MNNFLLDLWYDLREKKLWPVAALLVLAVVAVPVLLKSDSEAPAPPADTSASGAAPTALAAPAVTGEEDPTPVSDLGVFDPRNPFKKVVAADAGGDGGSTQGGGSATGGDTGAPADGPKGPGAAPGGGGGSPQGGSPGGGSLGNDGNEKPTDDENTSYTYTVEVNFGRRDSERKRSLERLEYLPSSRQPLLVFMGVSSDRKSAVFLVDSSLDQTGEGTCKPSSNECSFVYLRVDDDQNDHYLADKETGAEYHLELLAINKVSTKALAARNRRMRKANMARASRLKKKDARPFHFAPLLVDEQG
jgi:hypothetical protein